MKTTVVTPSTRKVRRDVRGGKRGNGRQLQRQRKRIRRPDPRNIRLATRETGLTGVAGLVEFAAFVQERGTHRELARYFNHLKTGAGVVYPMAAQLRLLIDLHVVGEGRVFGLEAMAHDPLFVQLAGGTVPSVDVLYDDLARFGEKELMTLERLVTEQAFERLRQERPEIIHIDIDTTVTELFGSQEGALAGPNPRYRGRPSYHPMLARIAETGDICGAVLRPGNRGFGADDVPTVVMWLERIRNAVGPDCLIRVRIDAAGDLTELLSEFERLGVHYYTKARMTRNLTNALTVHSPWRSVDYDAMGKPTLQAATVLFQRPDWNHADITPRVVGLRSRERENGKLIHLWEHLDYTAQAFITNDETLDEEEIARFYNDRAGIEPIIGELKSAWCIGKAPSALFDANHAAFLIKLLAYNLYRAFLAARYGPLRKWRTSWTRQVVILRPGRLVRSGRRTTVQAPRVYVPMLC